MKKNFKKVISFALLVCMMASLACYYPVGATGTTETNVSDCWTYIDLATDYNLFQKTTAASKVPYTYTVSTEDGTGDQMVTLGATANTSDGGMYTNTTLEAGKDYMISVKMKFADIIVADDTDKTFAASLMFGVTPSTVVDTGSPWDTGNGGKTYAAVLRRAKASSGKAVVSWDLRVMAIGMTKIEVAKTVPSSFRTADPEWVEVSVYVTQSGEIYQFFNGVCYGYHETTEYNGGRLGLHTWNHMKNSPVYFKDLKYKEITNVAIDEVSYEKVDDFDFVANVAASKQASSTAKWKLASEKSEDGSNIFMFDQDDVNTTGVTGLSMAVSKNVTLKPGTAYTVEAQVKFAEAFDASAADKDRSQGFGIVIGNIDPSADSPFTNSKSMVAWIQRRDAKAYLTTQTIDRSTYTNTWTSTTGALTSDQIASIDWLTIRLTVTADGIWTLYLDGEQVGESSTSLYNEVIYGSDSLKLALVNYGIGTQVYFKDVWCVEGSATAELDNFNYVGTSIRYATDGTQGIRVKTFLSSDITNATIAEDGYKVVEYGTLVALADSDYTTTLTKGATGVACAVAYSEKDGVDKYFERTEDGTIYTVALYNIEDATQHYAFRAYYVIEDAEGNQTVCYLNAYSNANQNIKSLADVAQMIKDSVEYDTLSTDKKDYIDSILPTA